MQALTNNVVGFFVCLGDVTGNNGDCDYWIVKLDTLIFFKRVSSSITDVCEYKQEPETVKYKTLIL